MTSQSETGHAKNVAQFETLVTNVSSFAEAYNPSNNVLKLEALESALGASKEAIAAVNAFETAYKRAVAARDEAFAPLSKLFTRVINSLKSSASSSQVDEIAISLNSKLQGRRATPKMTEEEKKAAEAEGKQTNQISSSQMSFDNRLNNFDKLIKLLASEPEYKPNEVELTVDTLTSLYDDLVVINKAVILAAAPLSGARIRRDQVLYSPDSGIVDISTDVKNYVKSVFGASSPQYKSISGLKFTSPK